jgi:DNA-binding MarR family transcriptional regulator
MAHQPTQQDYQTLAAFRLRLRRFFAFSAEAASTAGMAPQQYQALLAIKGHEGDGPPSISDLAAQLLVKQHTAVELAKRLDEGGLVLRQRDPSDGRVVLLVLTPRAEEIMSTLAGVHLEELRLMAPALAGLLRNVRSD